MIDQMPTSLLEPSWHIVRRPALVHFPAQVPRWADERGSDVCHEHAESREAPVLYKGYKVAERILWPDCQSQGLAISSFAG